MSRKPPALPDLDDDAAFRRKLSPLAVAILPDNRKSSVTELATAVVPQERNSGSVDSRSAGNLECGNADRPEYRTSGRVGAAEAQARVEAARGTKKRFEYLIPERVGRALAQDAAAQGKSATVRLLEVLRDAGYPVIQEDLIDLRKMPKR